MNEHRILRTLRLTISLITIHRQGTDECNSCCTRLSSLLDTRIDVDRKCALNPKSQQNQPVDTSGTFFP
jgi:hypothetical protein